VWVVYAVLEAVWDWSVLGFWGVTCVLGDGDGRASDDEEYL